MSREVSAISIAIVSAKLPQHEIVLCPLAHELLFTIFAFLMFLPPQWGAADAEIKVPSGENTELKRSPFKAWSKSVYSHAYYAYCQGFLS